MGHCMSVSMYEYEYVWVYEYNFKLLLLSSAYSLAVFNKGIVSSFSKFPCTTRIYNHTSVSMFTELNEKCYERHEMKGVTSYHYTSKMNTNVPKDNQIIVTTCRPTWPVQSEKEPWSGSFPARSSAYWVTYLREEINREETYSVTVHNTHCRQSPQTLVPPRVKTIRVCCPAYTSPCPLEQHLAVVSLPCHPLLIWFPWNVSTTTISECK